MRILFWGTPAFAVPALRALHDDGIEVVGVVTQPDRPAGRGRKLRPSALKEVALEYGLTVLTPERPRGEELLESIGALEPDMSVVGADYNNENNDESNDENNGALIDYGVELRMYAAFRAGRAAPAGRL